MFATWDDGMRLFLFQETEDSIRVIPPISYNVFLFDVETLQEFRSHYAVIEVSCGHFIDKWIA